MTVKEYLSQAFTIDQEIRSKEEQIQHLRDMQMDIGRVLSADKVQTTPDPHKDQEISAALLDLIDEYAKDVTRLLKVKYDIQHLIDQIEDVRYRLILTERYINLKRWEDVAVDNYYSWDSVHRIHRRALNRIESYTISMLSCKL